MPQRGGPKQLTDQQQLVVDTNVPPGSLIKVQAYAGTGKTSMFVSYADARPDVDMTYLAFNKSVETEAKQKFGRNVLVKTGHALAWHYVGRKFPKLAGSVQNWMIAKALRVPIYEATLVSKTLDTFLNSASTHVEEVHVEPDHRKKLREDYADGIRQATEAVWNAVQNGSHNFDMTHSGYLKLYQLSKPSVPGDIILLDEAQDTNPVMLDIILHQLKLGKSVLLCGDPYQQIYAWRGAENAMAQCEGDCFYLTRSFRFPQGVADIANVILKSFFNETVPLIGVDRPLEDYAHAGATTIARTNGEIFRVAADYASADQPFHVVGQEAFYALMDQVQDVFLLYCGKRDRIMDRKIVRHNTFADLVEFAEDTLDRELATRCRLVDTYRDQTPELLVKMRNLYQRTPSPGVPTLVTCHKAKGLEWDHVNIGEDYADLYDENNKRRVIGKELPAIASDEVNLYYVAATRAKRALHMNSQLSRLVTKASQQ